VLPTRCRAINVDPAIASGFHPLMPTIDDFFGRSRLDYRALKTFTIVVRGSIRGVKQWTMHMAATDVRDRRLDARRTTRTAGNLLQRYVLLSNATTRSRYLR